MTNEERAGANQATLIALLTATARLVAAGHAIDACLNMVDGDGRPPNWDEVRRMRSLIRSHLSEKEPG